MLYQMFEPTALFIGTYYQSHDLFSAMVQGVPFIESSSHRVIVNEGVFLLM